MSARVSDVTLSVHNEGNTTNPFSDGFVERRIALQTFQPIIDPDQSAVTDATEPFPEGFVEARIAGHQHVPITDLSFEACEACRVLLQPAAELDLHISSDFTSAEWVDLTLSKTDDDTKSDHIVKCLAVRQGPADIGVRIEFPLTVEMFFDSQSDAVELRNRSMDKLIDLRRLDSDDAVVSIAPYSSERLEPGAWSASAFGNPIAFQIMLFPRRYRLEVVQQSLGLLEVPSTSTSNKRRFSARIHQKALNSASASSSSSNNNVTSQLWDIVKPISSLTESQPTQTVRVAGGTGPEYTVYRMGNTGPSASSEVFTARLAQYQGQLVVVKVLKPNLNTSAASRAINWAREYGIHRRLQSDTIVPLHGGDARIDALFLAHINAKDLAHSTWCRHSTFLGTPSDAKRVLLDMARALAYLRTTSPPVIHNDIKPRNILYSRSMGATLIDFGLGSNDGDSPSMGGTPWYIPPEFLARGRRGCEADIWALGVVMLYLLGLSGLPDSGKDVGGWQIREIGGGGGGGRRGLAHNNAAERMAQWLSHVEQARKRLLANSGEPGSSGMEEVVLRMLESSPGERIRAEELLKRVEDIMLDDNTKT